MLQSQDGGGFRSVGTGQGWRPAGEVLEVVAVFIQALTCELVDGYGVVLLFGGRVQPVFELDLLNDHFLAVERNLKAAFALDEVIIGLSFGYNVSGWQR